MYCCSRSGSALLLLLEDDGEEEEETMWLWSLPPWPPVCLCGGWYEREGGQARGHRIYIHLLPPIHPPPPTHKSSLFISIPGRW